MKIKIIASTMLLTSLFMSSAQAATLTPEVAGKSPNSVLIQEENPKFNRENLIFIANKLYESKAEREVDVQGKLQRVTFKLGQGVKISFIYTIEGQAIDPTLPSTFVGYGWDSGGPYLSFDSAEQGPAAGGIAGTIGSTLRAALALETGGAGCIAPGGMVATVVSVLAAHGVCPNGQNFRMYFNIGGVTLTQCRND